MTGQPKQFKIVAISGWRNNSHNGDFLDIVDRLLWVFDIDNNFPPVFYRIGDCKTGTDAMAAYVLLNRHYNCQLPLPPHIYRAQWRQHGNKAGPMRNVAMLYGFDETDPFFGHRADLLVAWPEPLKRRQPRSGTWDCIEAAHKLGIPKVVL